MAQAGHSLFGLSSVKYFGRTAGMPKRFQYDAFSSDAYRSGTW